MKWPFMHHRRIVSAHIVEIDRHLAKIQKEIERLDKFISSPRPRKQREEVTIARLLGPTILPESKKRFVSYLSTGSFQTIGMRRHEKKAARIKMVLVIALILFLVFYVVYYIIIHFLS